MNRQEFRVVRLEATAPDGVSVSWRGKDLPTGPLSVALDLERASHGVLDYDACEARMDLHVLLSFPDLVEDLVDLGVDPTVLRPFRATVSSRGAILADHGFALAGSCRIGEHPLGEGAQASVLPGT